MIVTVGTTSTNLLEELKTNYIDKYELLNLKSTPIEIVAINNFDTDIDIHMQIVSSSYPDAVINDGKIIEARRGKEYTLNEFKKLHAIASDVNALVEIDFIHKEKR